jgi:signal peptidase II
VVALTVCLLDQVTKRWAQRELQYRPGRSLVLVSGYASLTYVRNPGAAWGVLAGSHKSFRRPFFIAVNLAAMAFILTIFWRLVPGQRMLSVALSLILGGALGNFTDRLQHDYVVDFIRVHYQARFYWPTFNVADVAISLGVALLLVEMFFGGWWERRQAARAAMMGPGEEREAASGEGEGPA